MALVVSEGHATAGVMLLWMACAANWGKGVIQAQVEVKFHVRFRGPTVARVSINVCGSCCNPSLSGCLGSDESPETMMVPKDHAAAGACERTGPVALHDLGWPWDIPEVFW